MVLKMFLVCLVTTILIACIEETAARNISTELVLSRNITKRSIRVRRQKDDVVSYVEELLGDGEVSEEKVDYSECGRVDVQAAPLITFGEKTERGKWPWHIALYYFEQGAHSYKCGGSLIGRRTVVTAAHCVRDNAGNTRDPSILVVYLGKYSLKLFSGVQEMQVTKVIVHPDYNADEFKADIAILTLSSSADYTPTVRPICLWEENQVLEKGALGTVIGWGRNEDGVITGDLMMTRMPIVPAITCIRSYPEFFGRILDEKKYCAGFHNGSNACNGDSGGGMAFPLPSNRLQKWYLRGIVSVGPGSANTNYCDPKHYVVFTDVSKHLDWIKKYLK